MRNMVLFKKSFLFVCLLSMTAISFSQVTEKWVKRENGDENAADAPKDLVVDNNGNVIVTGSGFGTIKYNDDGATKWVRSYNGPGNDEDEASAIVTDRNNNVYVTGWSTGSGSSRDYTTIKYDDDGNKKWVKRFNGTGNSADQATAIAVDHDGNVYVTGWSIGSGTGQDITTIKYDRDGNTKWVRNYNGPADSSDGANAIAVDYMGNVYVTGWSTGKGTFSDYTTIKYDRYGDQKWVKRYNGSMNNKDRASALALDNNGNVYITGLITIIEGEDGDVTDIATIKYNASGVQQWAEIYNRDGHDEARAIAVDSAGNVYLTGFSGDPELDPIFDYLTIKYNTLGKMQWVATLDAMYGLGQAGGATDLVLDKAGNVFVTGGISTEPGKFFATVKYNNNGVQQWKAIYAYGEEAVATGVDQNGNVYITGASNDDYTTIKYNTGGVQKWVKRYNSSSNLKGGHDLANALALDKDGNVYVTGAITRNYTDIDYGTYKYNNDGARIWKKTYNGTEVTRDEANGIAVDVNGNVYVTGSSFAAGVNNDYVTVKYGKDGESKWGKKFNGPGIFHHPSAIAVDKAGNVYVTGQSGDDYATVKYDKDGNTKWVKRYNGSANIIDQPTAIAVDANGNVYVTGQSYNTSTSGDFATIKYDAHGNQLWVAIYNGPANLSDGAKALAVDASGNVYVTGSSWASGNTDYTTIKYNTAGVQQWLARYTASASSFDDAKDIALDAFGNVYVTGTSLGDYATIKYNTSGVQQWVARYDAANSADEANALAVDAQGNVYVTGGSMLNFNSSSNDYATIKYNTAGVQQWVARYNGPANNRDIANDIAVDDHGNVYVTGLSVGKGTGFDTDYATIKYEQMPVITMSSTHPEPNAPVVVEAVSAKLYVKAFPNAFTDFINLQWRGSDKPVNITITDATGKLVEKKTGLASSGTLKTGNNFPQGIYFAEVVQGTDKLVLKLMKQ